MLALFGTRKLMGCQGRGNKRVVCLSVRKDSHLSIRNKRAAGLSGIGQLLFCSGTAEQLVCQEQESCWSVRNRRSAGLSGQESFCSVRKEAAGLSGTVELFAYEEHQGCRSGRYRRASGLSGTR
jgi:hypothetical protein